MRFGYTIVYVADVPATIEFYERAFGFGRRFVHEMGYGELETGATTLAFAAHELGEMNLGGKYIAASPSEKPLGIEIAFVCDDVEAAFQKAVENGAEALKKPTQKPWGQVVGYVRDLNGVLIELCSPMVEKG